METWRNESWKTAAVKPSWDKILKESGNNEGVAYSVYKTLQKINSGADPQKAFTDALEDENLDGNKPDVKILRQKAADLLKKYKIEVKS